MGVIIIRERKAWLLTALFIIMYMVNYSNFKG